VKACRNAANWEASIRCMAHAKKKAGENSRLSAPEWRAGQSRCGWRPSDAMMPHAMMHAMGPVMMAFHAMMMAAHHVMAMHAVVAAHVMPAVMGNRFGLDRGIGLHGGACGADRSGLGRDGGAENGRGRDRRSEQHRFSHGCYSLEYGPVRRPEGFRRCRDNATNSIPGPHAP
jgi:hypothetical protein